MKLGLFLQPVHKSSYLKLSWTIDQYRNIIRHTICIRAMWLTTWSEAWQLSLMLDAVGGLLVSKKTTDGHTVRRHGWGTYSQYTMARRNKIQPRPFTRFATTPLCSSCHNFSKHIIRIPPYGLPDKMLLLTAQPWFLVKNMSASFTKRAV